MTKSQIESFVFNHKKFKQLTTDPRAKEQVIFTKVVYHKDEEILLLFKYTKQYSSPGARYSLVNLKSNTYENMPSKTFTDFYLKHCDHYKEARLAF